MGGMEWWWYPLIALGAAVGVGALLAIFARDRDKESDLVPMGGRYVLRQPEHPTPKRRKGWRITIERH